MSRRTEIRSRRKIALQRLHDPCTCPEHWKSFEQVTDGSGGSGGRYAAIDACLTALQEIVRLNESESYWSDVMQDLRKKKLTPYTPAVRRR
jgi:hypothetical protein